MKQVSGFSRGVAALRQKIKGVPWKKIGGPTKALCAQTVCAVCAYAMAGAGIAHTVYPLGLGFIIGVNKKYVVCALIGFMAAGVFNGIPEFTVCISAAGVAAAIRLVADRGGRRPRRAFFAAAAGCALTLSASRLTVLFATQTATLPTVLLAVCEAVLTVVVAGFFYTAWPYIEKRRLDEAPAAHVLCVFISAFCIAAGAVGLDIGYVSFGRAAVIFACLLLCRAPSLARAGCCVFLVSALLFGEQAFYFASAGLALGCAGAACLSRSGKLVYSAAFVVCACSGALIAPNLLYALVYICELSAACALYMALPDRILDRILPQGDFVPVSAGVACATARLKAISLSFAEIAALLDRYCSAAPRYAAIEGVVDEVASSVCRGCTMMSLCWVKHYTDTFTDMCRLAEKLSAQGSVSVPDMGTALCASCINPLSVCAAFNAKASKIKLKICRDKNVALYRQALEAQFRSVSGMLSRTNRRLTALRPAEKQVNEKIARTAGMLGMSVCRAETMWVGERMTLSLWLNCPARQDSRDELVEKLQRITGRKLCETQVTITEKGVFMEYCEQPELRLEFAAFQGAHSEKCGDSYSTFSDCTGRTHLVLADGMGTGCSAAVDSAVCCALTRRLLENGFDPADCVQLVNSVLSIKEADEKAITMDTLTFDGYTGKATLLKAGAAPTFVVKGESVTALGHGTLPVGIMDMPRTKSCKVVLADGDVILMLTDGALAQGTKALSQLTGNSGLNTAEQLLDAVLDATDGFCDAQDDITLIVGRVSQYAAAARSL